MLPGAAPWLGPARALASRNPLCFGYGRPSPATQAQGVLDVDPGTSTVIREIKPVYDAPLFAGSICAQSSARHAYLFDGSQMNPMGGGVGASELCALAVTPEGYLCGGTYIAEAGLDDATDTSPLSAQAVAAGVAFQQRFTLGAHGTIAVKSKGSDTITCPD